MTGAAAGWNCCCGGSDYAGSDNKPSSCTRVRDSLAAARARSQSPSTIRPCGSTRSPPVPPATESAGRPAAPSHPAREQAARPHRHQHARTTRSAASAARWLASVHRPAANASASVSSLPTATSTGPGFRRRIPPFDRNESNRPIRSKRSASCTASTHAHSRSTGNPAARAMRPSRACTTCFETPRPRPTAANDNPRHKPDTITPSRPTNEERAAETIASPRRRGVARSVGTARIHRAGSPKPLATASHPCTNTMHEHPRPVHPQRPRGPPRTPRN